jgi:ATP-dependent DNA helicase RecQ
MTYPNPYEALAGVWGYDAFRPMQLEIIQSVLDRNDTIAILPTGGGKSICYQVPALCREGICIVISPLIALMKDQVDQLRSMGVSAGAVHSGMSEREIDVVLDNCVLGKTKLLYVSPERLKTELFKARAKRMPVSLLAVDEAHCISQWGYDFRPSYLEIAEFRSQLPSVTTLALTASATPKVREDMAIHLGFGKDYNLFVKSFHRPNLAYVIRMAEDKDKKLVDFLKKVNGCSIVYTRSRKRTKSIAVLLQKNGLSADHYHAGLSHKERNSKQERWMDDRTRIMVSTNAFGMGINKPDVRLVIHMDLPDNMESYYQEAGRAGRDEKKAIAVILCHEKDKEDLKQRIEQSVVDAPGIRRTYQALANYHKMAVGSSAFASHDFDLDQFCRTFSLEKLPAFHALKKLEELGFIQWNESFYHPSKVIFNRGHEEIYKFQVENPLYENLIRALLRIYGGEMYSGFLNISEKKIASSLKIPAADVAGQLETLHKFDILYYDQQKESPQVTFLTPRFDAAQLPIDSRLLEARKQNKLAQMETMIAYVESKNLCRSLFIQRYFGETSDRECGICDVCVAKKKLPENTRTINTLRLNILQILENTPMTVQDLIEKFPVQKRDSVMNIIRLLLDTSQVLYDEVNCLHVSKRE